MIRIPLVIHQIWSNVREPLPENLSYLSNSWKNDYPNWEYILWDDEKINCFIDKFYPMYKIFFNSFLYDIQRWDFIRYLILLKIGGMYVDIDYQSLVPLNDLIENLTCCFAEEEIINVSGKEISYFNNALMCSIPDHPFLQRIIDNILSMDYCKLNSLPKNVCVLNSTGPWMLTKLYQKLSESEKKDIFLIPKKYVTPFSVNQARMIIRGYENAELESLIKDAYAIHYFLGSW